MPRYVILEHDWPQRHWDFMLEAGAALETWKLSAAPSPGVSIPAEKSFDHRLMYLDYEGPIGGGRGAVTRWDAGSYELISESRARSKRPTKRRAHSNRQVETRRVFRLQGERLHGTVEMTDNPKSGWSCYFSDDEGMSV